MMVRGAPCPGVVTPVSGGGGMVSGGGDNLPRGESMANR